MQARGPCYGRSWNDRRRPFGIDLRYRDEEKLENSIRQLFLTSAGDVPALATSYLVDVAADPERRRRIRDEIVGHCGQLIRHLPTQLVDFMLSAFLDKPDGESPFHSSGSLMGDQFGIDGHESFYPPSPMNLPFLGLLRVHEAEGLRLVKGICNHSINMWRWARSHDHNYGPATPIPTKIAFPWGEQILWGDGQVYLWFRGVWANYASSSALMALEQWAFDQLDANADFGEVLRKCVEGQESVAALGLGASLCVA